MTQDEKYTIQCGQCQEEFPIVVRIQEAPDDKKAVKSRELSCPFCDTLLTFELPANQRFVDDGHMIKGVKKMKE